MDDGCGSVTRYQRKICVLRRVCWNQFCQYLNSAAVARAEPTHQEQFKPLTPGHENAACPNHFWKVFSKAVWDVLNIRKSGRHVEAGKESSNLVLSRIWKRSGSGESSRFAEMMGRDVMVSETINCLQRGYSIQD
jgi:hypothetical protein